eukprot:gnl/TRDRNA2_/TRDRNA2_193889_c0_seq1.p1 gnl/TRDRNA2_/TRDRNA2_193889_c0~~gnl/TRDRNA2_/TRDRNA2_193889_c0_seq1.p1  ORF type:complete len:365 (-),score=34.86 gnl/TRDRNA2_/TRDRNA2_193889_c0_seq1:100-1194(-)
MPKKTTVARPPRPSPLQNRVDVYGALVRTNVRGKVMGNRGILHDEAYRIVRPWKLKMWISCVLHTDRTREVQLDDNRAFNGRKRELMSLWHYTELFYLDEVTALATGARPCGCCRRTDYDAFKEAWRRSRGLGSRPLNSAMMDDELHASRLASAGRVALRRIDWSRNDPPLPDGTMVDFSDEQSAGVKFNGAYLVWEGFLRKWSWEGYGPPLHAPTAGSSAILTPACIVDCLRGGYRPVHCPFVAGIDELVRPWQDPPNGRADTPPSHLHTTDWTQPTGRGRGRNRGRGSGYPGGSSLRAADKRSCDEDKVLSADDAKVPKRDDVHPEMSGLVESAEAAPRIVRRWRKKSTVHEEVLPLQEKLA